jgi:hypothetical protein
MGLKLLLGRIEKMKCYEVRHQILEKWNGKKGKNLCVWITAWVAAII